MNAYEEKIQAAIRYINSIIHISVMEKVGLEGALQSLREDEYRSQCRLGGLFQIDPERISLEILESLGMESSKFNDDCGSPESYEQYVRIYAEKLVLKLEEFPKKPPIGIPPYWITTAHRISEILKAITRYSEAGIPIPEIYTVELEKQTSLYIWSWRSMTLSGGVTLN